MFEKNVKHRANDASNDVIAHPYPPVHILHFLYLLSFLFLLFAPTQILESKIGIKKSLPRCWNFLKYHQKSDPNAGICSEKNYFIPKLLNSHWVKRLHLSFSWEIVQFSLQHLYSQRGVKLEVSRLTIQDKNFQKRYNNHSSWCCQRSLPDYNS